MVELWLGWGFDKKNVYTDRNSAVWVYTYVRNPTSVASLIVGNLLLWDISVLKRFGSKWLAKN